MQYISCNVDSCANNRNGGCFSSSLNVSGSNATNSVETFCESYVAKSSFSNMLNQSLDNKPADRVGCSVGNCKFNSNNACSKNRVKIDVSQGNLGTECESFVMKTNNY